MALDADRCTCTCILGLCYRESYPSEKVWLSCDQTPTAQPSISHFLANLGAQVQPDIAHPCCDKLTAIKTGFPVTSIT